MTTVPSALNSNNKLYCRRRQHCINYCLLPCSVVIADTSLHPSNKSPRTTLSSRTSHCNSGLMTLQCAGVRTEPVDRRKGPCPPLSGYSSSIGGEHYNYTSLLVYFLSLKYIRTLLSVPYIVFNTVGHCWNSKEEGNKHHLQFTVSSNL